MIEEKKRRRINCLTQEISEQRTWRKSKKLNSKEYWWLQRGGSPLPIPNRVVKLLSADGTADLGGRVGRRQSL